MDAIEKQALSLLRTAYGAGAEFRPGQLEAIVATLVHKRTLIVQKTGWGKSIIYFIAARILRQNGRGSTIVISPLLELMNNQIELAERFRLRCEVLNSTVKGAGERGRILRRCSAMKSKGWSQASASGFLSSTRRIACLTGATISGASIAACTE